MLVVSDVQDVFVPLVDGFLVKLSESEAMIDMYVCRRQCFFNPSVSTLALIFIFACVHICRRILLLELFTALAPCCFIGHSHCVVIMRTRQEDLMPNVIMLILGAK